MPFQTQRVVYIWASEASGGQSGLKFKRLIMESFIRVQTLPKKSKDHFVYLSPTGTHTHTHTTNSTTQRYILYIYKKKSWRLRVYLWAGGGQGGLEFQEMIRNKPSPKKSKDHLAYWLHRYNPLTTRFFLFYFILFYFYFLPSRLMIKTKSPAPTSGQQWKNQVLWRYPSLNSKRGDKPSPGPTPPLNSDEEKNEV